MTQHAVKNDLTLEQQARIKSQRKSINANERKVKAENALLLAIAFFLPTMACLFTLWKFG